MRSSAPGRGDGRGQTRRVSPRLAVALWAVSSVGCSGCYQPAVVPPTASIPHPRTPPATSVPAPVLPELPPLTNRQPPPGNPWQPAAAVREWKYLVLHHTASETGDVESIHNAHLKNKDKNGNPWLGIGYHFVIGNGQGMPDGEIAETFRWKQQLPGAHAGVGEYNQHGIGICLVGNFENKPPTSDQLTSVKRLVQTLTREYGIDGSHVIGHGDVKATECPGQHFPLSDVRAGVAAVERPDGIPVAQFAAPSWHMRRKETLRK